ncbi:HAMP domain-containing sensor histidine kinase [Kiloniella laminariae]|uniref:histidine kinase n=1 Tax=Kiloniella laminariae TaxID=454162 RepID=A0ABT4LQP2_9PROT|nr:HAMP domain-containing sensor histidine kinase [Kiloniella laminariae]MCZ4282252.1 HAMP domain-containing sensor histidine kinase [Kiloniella laminariae]
MIKKVVNSRYIKFWIFLLFSIVFYSGLIYVDALETIYDFTREYEEWELDELLLLLLGMAFNYLLFLLFSLKSASAKALSSEREITQLTMENGAKYEFLTSMSHELRTPLNAVIGFSEMMRNEIFGPISPEKYKAYIDDIHESSGQLLTIIDKLLALSYLDTYKITLLEAEQSVLSLLKESIEASKIQASSKGIEITLKCSCEDTVLTLDPAMIKKSFVEILNNAVLNSPENTEIFIKIDRDLHKRLRITIQDQGPGISKDALRGIFEPFNQIDRNALTSSTGLGLGLTISKRYIELHGGSLRLKSKIREGTTVTITFPTIRDKPAQG